MLVTRRELGRGWTATAAGSTAISPLTWPAFSPFLPADRLIGSAQTARFQGGAYGPFVTQESYVYATRAQARQVARAVMRPGLTRCLAASLTGGSTATVRFRVTRRLRRPAPRVGVTATGYRVRGIASQVDQSANVYLDAIVLARGSTLTEVSFATFETPPASTLESRVARVIARRLLR